MHTDPRRPGRRGPDGLRWVVSAFLAVKMIPRAAGEKPKPFVVGVLQIALGYALRGWSAVNDCSRPHFWHGPQAARIDGDQ